MLSIYNIIRNNNNRGIVELINIKEGEYFSLGFDGLLVNVINPSQNIFTEILKPNFLKKIKNMSGIDFKDLTFVKIEWETPYLYPDGYYNPYMEDYEIFLETMIREGNIDSKYVNVIAHGVAEMTNKVKNKSTDLKFLAVNPAKL